MSHELRTPLNGVLGYAQLLQRDRSLTPTQREALEAISKCGSQLLDLINDVLDLSKIEAGRLDIEEAPTDLAKLDHRPQVRRRARPRDRKGLRLTMSIAPDVPRSRRPRRPAPASGAAESARQRDQVHRGRRRAAGHRARPRAIACASRSPTPGLGIEPEALTEIFEAFAQTKTGAAAGGTGLGLTICDHLIAKMGGELKVDSALGEGSRFWFTLPLVDGRPTTPRSDAGRARIAAAAARRQARAGREAHRPGRRRQHGQPPHPGQPARERRRPRHHRGWRTRGDRARARRIGPTVIFMDLKMNDLDGLRGDAAAGTRSGDGVDPRDRGDGERAWRQPAGARATPAASTTCRSRFAPSLLFAMLQTHLGVRFVSESDHPSPRRRRALDRRSTDASKWRPGCATPLRSAT